MKKVILSLLLSFLTILLFAQVQVKGYYRKNGTYVQPHVRSSPDSNPYNNYSYPGNTNPYTGKVATGNPDTYLYNYYKNGASDFTPRNDKIFLQNANGTETGEYLKLYDWSEKTKTYNLFDSGDKYNGYVVINKITGYMRIYDKDSKLAKEIYPSSDGSNQINSILQPQKPVTNEFSEPTSPVSTKVFPDILSIKDVNDSEKEYLKDKNGNYTGYYRVLEDSDKLRNKYSLYDNIDNFQGNVVQFNNGEVFIYNFAGRLIKHTLPSSNQKKVQRKKL